MPSAGAVCPPVILPIRKQVYGQSTSKIDTSTLIEIICGKIFLDTFLCLSFFSIFISIKIFQEKKKP